MKSSFSFLVICAISLCLVLVVVSYYLFSTISANPQKDKENSAVSDTLRSHGVTDLASKLSYIASDKKINWPQQWQQIGTGTSDCQVKTVHCQILLEECFNASLYANGKFVLPIDSARGSIDKTGYAIRQQGNKLEIVACYSESSTASRQEIRL